jgi:hypothetical protein
MARTLVSTQGWNAQTHMLAKGRLKNPHLQLTQVQVLTHRFSWIRREKKFDGV